MSPSRLPRLELTENPNNKNEFIIFRHQIKAKKIFKDSKIIPNKKTINQKKHKHKNNKTKNKRSKNKKSKSLFNIF